MSTNNRREFLRSLIGGVAIAGAVRSWPFRVFSFPSKIEVPQLLFLAGDIVQFAGVHQINPCTREELPMLKSFVITENVYSRGDEEKAINVAPAILAKDPYQNCTAPQAFKPILSKMSSAMMVRHLKIDDFKRIHPDAATREEL